MKCKQTNQRQNCGRLLSFIGILPLSIQEESCICPYRNTSMTLCRAVFGFINTCGFVVGSHFSSCSGIPMSSLLSGFSSSIYGNFSHP
ncbi:hypothetical protein GDO78_014790 [Eleutherodactylus coqui]|uniref:Uncharacterized protein n=1 Tax=Eleutherodactylus coqui TaxID=57060 RepID=A0A8J6JPS7_ELECQ|nr:hypothetical protein GDO78_014790 [Eleutherodactylus coqui]